MAPAGHRPRARSVAEVMIYGIARLHGWDAVRPDSTLGLDQFKEEYEAGEYRLFVHPGAIAYVRESVRREGLH